jgi:two-component system, chemotaxis family, sensor kinase CheA
MSFDADEEILQDFLVEAGEILEVLSEQLVELENRPDDANLLNAIFRGFHTVKGGAGFLQLDPLVELCHAAENAFDLLRNNKLKVTSELMDVVLQSLDAVNGMFAQVNARAFPEPADPALMHALHAIIHGEVPASSQTAPAHDEPAEAEPEAAATSGDITDEEFEQLLGALDEEKAPATKSAAGGGDIELFGEDEEVKAVAKSGSSEEITEAEFEALLDQLHGKGKPVGAAPAQAKAAPAAKSASGEEITDDEFEALLDELHGKGKHGGTPKAETASDAKPAAPAGSGDLITDDEFEALLDQLHGKGKSPTAMKAAAEKAPAKPESPAKTDKPPAKPAAKAPASAASAAEAKPAPKPEPKPAAPAKAVAHDVDEDGDERRAGVRGGAAAPKEAAAENTVRVDTKRLDDIMNMVGELVLVRNRLVRLGLRSADEDLAKAVANLDVVTGDLQTAVMKTRMQPIKKVFGRFPRVVRDLARNLKKEINLELEGEETDLDKNLVEALADPLVHLVRNSVDHGIEAPDVREKMGKPRTGRVVLAAEQEGDHIVLSITDDGGGMDPAVLRRKAAEKGLMDAETAERLSDQEAFNLIFHPGFSTKDQISDVSGRGVGMDVVKTKISQLNGTIDVKSEKNIGTRIAIKVPLTLAIMPTLMVMLGKQAFALPLVNVNEIFHLDLSRTNVVDGQEVVVVREKALPLFHLKRWLVRGAPASEREAHVVIVSVGTQKVGFVVDQLIGQEEVVIKPLGKMLHGTPGMAGATITGDGRIALILDIPSMLKAYAHRS